MEEHQLILSAKNGDLDAFNTLILTYQDHLYSIALRITTDEDAAADAVQEALLSAFRHIQAFRNGCFRSWLARITVNACYDELRRKSRRPTQPLELVSSDGQEVDLNDWLSDSNPGTEYQIESSELEYAIHDALRSLTPLYRAAVVLVDVQGYSYEEAADILRIPVGTIRSRLARARSQLRLLLGDVEDLMPVPVWFNIRAGSYHQVPSM
jgi:RNA polymerase sigma-70 factor, ECF subfamily